MNPDLPTTATLWEATCPINAAHGLSVHVLLQIGGTDPLFIHNHCGCSINELFSALDRIHQSGAGLFLVTNPMEDIIVLPDVDGVRLN